MLLKITNLETGAERVKDYPGSASEFVKINFAFATTITREGRGAYLIQCAFTGADLYRVEAVKK